MTPDLEPVPVTKLVVVADTHACSDLGLQPPNFTLKNGHVDTHSPKQAAVWDKWTWFWDVFVPRETEGKPYAVALAGDLMDNDHHDCKQLVSREKDDHEAMARDIFWPIRRRTDHLFIVAGTRAHSGQLGEMETHLAESLGANREGTCQTRGRGPWLVRINLVGGSVEIGHHIGVSHSPVTQHTALTKLIVDHYLKVGQWRRPMARVLIRAHRHASAQAWLPSADGGTRAIVVPSWQYPTEWFGSGKPEAIETSEFGGCVVHMDRPGTPAEFFIWTAEYGQDVPMLMARPKKPQRSSPGKRLKKRARPRKRRRLATG